MLREIKGTQLKPRMLAFKLTGTGTAALGEGKFDGVLVDNGTGDYTITFSKAFVRTPVIQICPLTAGIHVKIHAVSATAVQIKTYAVDGTTATDAVVDVLALGWDNADQT